VNAAPLPAAGPVVFAGIPAAARQDAAVARIIEGAPPPAAG
jgi:hypothetical protein